MAVSNGAGRVFTWFANMTSVAGLMSWFGICVTYVRFYAGLKAQGFDRTTLPFHSRFQPYLGWYGVFSTIIICFVRLRSSLFHVRVLISLHARSSADGACSSRETG